MLNLAQCGADVTGAIDSFARIQAAFDRLSDNDEIYVPQKAVFLTSATLTISNLERFKLFGPGTIQPADSLAALPVIQVVNSRHSLIEQVTILGNTSNPPSAGLRFHRVASGGFAPTGMIVRDVRIGSTSTGSIVDGIDFTADVDSNNAESEIYGAHIQNFSGAGVHYEHQNSLQNRIVGGVFESFGAGGTSSVGIKASGGGSFQVFGTDLLVQDWDFDISGDLQHAFEVFGVHAESDAKILRFNSSSGKPMISFYGYHKKAGTPGVTNIDVDAAEANIQFFGCHMNEGLVTCTYDFSDTSSRALFSGCRIGCSTITYNGRLVMMANVGTGAPITFTGGGSSLRELFGNSGSGFDLSEQSVHLSERSDLSAPATNNVVIYARDTGGKTELVARFPTGAIQQLAIEP